MKVFFATLALLAVAQAGLIAAPAATILSTGASSQSRSQDALGNYAFNYNEQGATGGSSRSESGSPLGVRGQYTLNVADGRQRVVNYVADGLGFRAAISTNEQGTAAAAPAAVAINAPVIAHAAPAFAPAIAAPAFAPALAAPAIAHGYAAPAFAAPVPLASTYSTAINHAAFAAPAFAAPAFAAPAYGKVLL